MDKPRAIVLRPSMPTSSQGRTLTFMNGFYTIKTTSSQSQTTQSQSQTTPPFTPTIVTPRSPTVSHTVVASRILPRIITPHPAPPQNNKIVSKVPLTAPIPTSVMEIRKELQSVQCELKHCMTTHTMHQHKLKLVGRHLYCSPDDIAFTKEQCKEIVARIAQLKARQDALIKAVREGLVEVGVQMPNAKVKRSDIGVNATLYKSKNSRTASSKAKSLAAATVTLPHSPQVSPPPPPKRAPPILTTSTTVMTTQQEYVPSHLVKSASLTATASAAPRPPSVDVDVVGDQLMNPTTLDSVSDTDLTLGRRPAASTSNTQATQLLAALAKCAANDSVTHSPVTRNSSTPIPPMPKLTRAEVDEEDIEVIKVVSSASLASKAPTKPHLLTKPVSMSPVPPVTNERDALYSSVQEAHLKAVQKVNPAQASNPEQQQCIDFMTSLDLVTPDTLNHLEKKKLDRRRITRSRFEMISNPQLKRGNEFLASVAAKRARRSPRTASPSSPAVTRSKAATPPPTITLSEDEDGSLHEDFCAVCSKNGQLLLCDTCTQVYHLECISLKTVPVGKWSCAKCTEASAPRPRPAVPTSKAATAISAVQQFVQTKAVKDEERAKLLKRNTELMGDTKSLKEKLQSMDKVIDEQMKKRTELKDENQNIRNLFSNMVGLVKTIKRLTR